MTDKSHWSTTDSNILETVGSKDIIGISLWVRQAYRDGLSLCQVWRFWFKSFWFYRADRQTDKIRDADDRYTGATTVGVVTRGPK